MIDQSTAIQWAKDAGFYIHHNPSDVWLIRGSANSLQHLITRAMNEAFEQAAQVADADGFYDSSIIAGLIRGLKQEPLK